MPWTVNGELIDEEAVREQMRLMRPRYEEEMSGMEPVEAEMQLRDWARENVIEQMLLRKAASEASSLASENEELPEEQQIKRFLDSLYATVAKPSPKELQAFYKKNRERFRQEERIHAKHILKEVNEQQDEAAALALIDVARGELEAGSPFEEVADRHSDCSGNGGDLGWFPRGEMVEEFDRVVFALAPGALSETFRTPFGWHIAKVYERRSAGIPTFQEVENQIAEAILQARNEEALVAFLDNARAKATVKRV